VARLGDEKFEEPFAGRDGISRLMSESIGLAAVHFDAWRCSVRYLTRLWPSTKYMDYILLNNAHKSHDICLCKAKRELKIQPPLDSRVQIVITC
jgi:hypothetical protein